ncbi:hypothetical protein [Kocuria aegyptia]|uniref:Uncharacterized protein n=1 Tax=Kocuria aegyptia TaxID=330943 RepID=A0ABP4WYW0_9MICC
MSPFRDAADTGVAVGNGSAAGGPVLGGETELPAAGAAPVLRRRSAARS